MSNNQVLTLCNDIMDSYPTESIEDVRECLKNGRRGVYGFGMNSRSSLNMILFREWMTNHLEIKAELRTKRHEEKNKKSSEALGKILDSSHGDKVKFEKVDPIDIESRGEDEYKKYRAGYIMKKSSH